TAVLLPVRLDLHCQLAVHRRDRHRLGDVDVTGEEILRVEAEGEVVVGPKQEGDEAADREEEPEREPVPGAYAVGERACAEERARERGREDHGRGPSLQTLDCALLL